jgi:hypothetical protein
MSTQRLHPDLEGRIAELENEANQGAGLTGTDWIWLILLGAVGPVLLLIWGWMS